MQKGRCAFIFIGGMQPKNVRVDDRPRTCPRCGLPSARLMRRDNYLSLFLIPLVPLVRGEEYLECRTCGVVSAEDEPPRRRAPEHCPRCHGALEPHFSFCPHCGARL